MICLKLNLVIHAPHRLILALVETGHLRIKVSLLVKIGEMLKDKENPRLLAGIIKYGCRQRH
ncbi:hypothetical protein RJ41_08040 [Alteromonas marina]|uniref:Uncharacterized protein n=1 Tax=Alteromonas marina TaxID=203795 RepID=A0A0B3YBQ8_9ALTE|nr:hypothetical protein RJ41_08040 [Alteromonas marina]